MDQSISWAEFNKECRYLESEYEKLDIRNQLNCGPYLYRGQGDAELPIESSLERFSATEKLDLSFNYLKYVKAISECVPMVNGFVGGEKFRAFLPEKVCEYGVDYGEYLNIHFAFRHVGIPSPFIDFTQDYKIAAYFACLDGIEESDAAIYAYNVAGILASFEGEAVIKKFAPEVDSKPYMAQKAWGLQCTRFIDEEKKLENFEKTISERSEYCLQKFVIKGSEKGQVLAELEKEGITAESLFLSDPGDALREKEVKDAVNEKLRECLTVGLTPFPD